MTNKDWKKNSLWDESAVITMRDIAKSTNWEEVQRAMLYHYPNGKWSTRKYRPIFEQIRDCRKRIPKDADPLVISVGGLRSLRDIEESGEVIDEFYDISGEEYGLSFQKWNKLANTPITKETLRHYTSPDMLAHFIWEITFYGTEKEIEKKKNKMLAIVKKIKKEGIQNGKVGTNKGI